MKSSQVECHLQRMVASIIALLLLFSRFASLHSFTLPRRWIMRQQTTIRAASPLTFDTRNRKLDEVLIGSLPSNFDDPQLKTLLQQRGVSNYFAASVNSYGTSDGGKYGIVKFDGSSLAQSAVSALQDLSVIGARAADVSLMPNVSSIYMSMSDPNNKEYQLCFLATNEDVCSIEHNVGNNPLLGAFVSCQSPAHAARLLRQLSYHDWQDLRVKSSLMRKSEIEYHCICISNLDIAMTREGMKKKLNELLGPDQFTALVLKRSFKEESRFAFVTFDTNEQRKRAVKLLDGVKLMGSPMEVSEVKDLAPGEPKHGMRLNNIDAGESADNIEALCNEALAGSGTVSSVKLRKTDTDTENQKATSSCIVYFTNSEACAKCIRNLHGKVWKGKVLRCDPSSRRKNISLYVTNIPTPWAEEVVADKIRQILGDTPYKRIGWRMDNFKKNAKRRFIHVDFFSPEDAYVAMGQFNGGKEKGVKLVASYVG